MSWTSLCPHRRLSLLGSLTSGIPWLSWVLQYCQYACLWLYSWSITRSTWGTCPFWIAFGLVCILHRVVWVWWWLELLHLYTGSYRLTCGLNLWWPLHLQTLWRWQCHVQLYTLSTHLARSCLKTSWAFLLRFPFPTSTSSSDAISISHTLWRRGIHRNRCLSQAMNVDSRSFPWLTLLIRRCHLGWRLPVSMDKRRLHSANKGRADLMWRLPLHLAQGRGCFSSEFESVLRCQANFRVHLSQIGWRSALLRACQWLFRFHQCSSLSQWCSRARDWCNDRGCTLWECLGIWIKCTCPLSKEESLDLQSYASCASARLSLKPCSGDRIWSPRPSLSLCKQWVPYQTGDSTSSKERGRRVLAAQWCRLNKW